MAGLLGYARGWLSPFNNFSSGNNIECRLREARHRFSAASDPASGAPALPTHARAEIKDHLDFAGSGQAGQERRRTVPFEIRLRELFTAERELIPYLPGSRCAAALADLRTDIGVWVPAARQATLFTRLDEAAEMHKGNDPLWRDLLFAVKCEADEIIIDSYRARERVRDGIMVLGTALAATVLLMIASIAVSQGYHGSGLFSVAPESADVGRSASGAALVWMCFLCGSLGACLSGLLGFTVNRAAPGEYETIAATVIRPLIGGACGMLAVALVALGLLNLGDQQIPALAIGAVILGFSERVVMGAVESLGARVGVGGTAGAGAATNPAGTPAAAPTVRVAGVAANDARRGADTAHPRGRTSDAAPAEVRNSAG